MPNILMILITCSVLLILWSFYRRSLISKREKLIDSYEFPNSIKQKVNEKYPHLNDEEVTVILAGLREYFQICNLAGRRMVSMPSQAVDSAWHEFILFTKQYQQFCRRCFGRFLHHTPAEAMSAPTDAQKGIKNAWRIACLREGQAPKSASKLPLLFAIDAKLNIPDGFKYSLNCKKADSHPYCASHIGCGSCGSSGCSGDSSGCSSGCGGGD